MKKRVYACLLLASSCCAIAGAPPAPSATVVPHAFGYFEIPNAALKPDPKRSYRAVFDAGHGVEVADKPLMVLNIAGWVLNALAAGGVAPGHAKLVIVFHDDATDAILDNDHYKARYKTDNPNLKPIAELKKAGVALYVCGQGLIDQHIDAATLTPDVTVAAGAPLVLIAYQNDGYALMSF